MIITAICAQNKVHRFEDTYQAGIGVEETSEKCHQSMATLKQFEKEYMEAGENTYAPHGCRGLQFFLTEKDEWFSTEKFDA